MDINQISRLAQLQLNETELSNLNNDLNAILNFVEQMNNAETDNCEPLAHPLELNQRLRNDDVTTTNQREELLNNAPAADKGLFLVPKVIDEN